MVLKLRELGSRPAGWVLPHGGIAMRRISDSSRSGRVGTGENRLACRGQGGAKHEEAGTLHSRERP